MHGECDCLADFAKSKCAVMWEGGYMYVAFQGEREKCQPKTPTKRVLGKEAEDPKQACNHSKGRQGKRLLEDTLEVGPHAVRWKAENPGRSSSSFASTSSS
jgi:hypothetical protein